VEDNGNITTRKIQIASAEFDTSSEVTSVKIATNQAFEVGGKLITFRGYADNGSMPAQMTFYPGLLVKAGILNEATELLYSDGSRQVHKPGPISFDKNGKVTN
jgi:hypothetical protein